MSDNMPVSENLTREELYEKVWSQPVPALASSLGISNSELAKLCQKLNIPMPGRGYWWRMEMGIPAERTPLPDLVNVEETKVPLDLPEKPPKPQKQLTETERRIAEEKKLENRIVVSDQLVSPHPLVEKTQRSLASAKADSEGRGRPKAKGCLDVCVAPSSIDRAMRIMDAVIKALEARGYVVTTSGEKQGETQVMVSEETIPFSLNELLDRREKEMTPAQKRERERDEQLWGWRRRPEYDRFPSGRLSLSIEDCPNVSNSHRKWSDGSKQRVEDRLNSFIASLIQAAEDIKDARRRHEEREREWQEKEQRRREEELRKKESQWRAKVLESKLAAWQHVQQIRAFITAVRAEVIRRHGQVEEGTEIARWLAWAERYATRHDPLAESNELPTYSPDEEARRKLEWSSNWGSYSSDDAWPFPSQPR